MKNISELTTDLSALYGQLRDGTVDIKLATELNNTAGKIISAHKVQLAYHALRDEKPTIPFLAAPVRDAQALLQESDGQQERP
jgi:adhesin HecA-like repeat protein